VNTAYPKDASDSASVPVDPCGWRLLC